MVPSPFFLIVVFFTPSVFFFLFFSVLYAYLRHCGPPFPSPCFYLGPSLASSNVRFFFLSRRSVPFYPSHLPSSPPPRTMPPYFLRDDTPPLSFSSCPRALIFLLPASPLSFPHRCPPMLPFHTTLSDFPIFKTPPPPLRFPLRWGYFLSCVAPGYTRTSAHTSRPPFSPPQANPAPFPSVPPPHFAPRLRCPLVHSLRFSHFFSPTATVPFRFCLFPFSFSWVPFCHTSPPPSRLMISSPSRP